MVGGFPKPEKPYPPPWCLLILLLPAAILTAATLRCSCRRRPCRRRQPRSSCVVRGFPEAIQRLVGRFPRFWGTVTSRPRIWYPGDQQLEGIDRRDAGGRHRGRVGSCRLRPEEDS